MANYREEHIRNNRRLARQVVGAVALLLALIGLFTVLGWIVGLVRAALDDTDLRNEYRDRLYGMVMLDPVAFDDVNSVDEGIFKQAAIWGTVYQVQNSGGSLDQYERDPDTGSALIPALEIDTYISNLLGPDYQVTEGTFSTAEFVYQYDEEKQAYLVPVTSSVALYTPTVEKITKKDGQRIVTVGYVPTSSNNATGELSLTAPTEPTKYMDYVFTRGENRQWYLTALRDSDMQIEVTPIPAPTDAVVDNMQNEEMGTSDAASTEPAPVPEEGAEAAPDAENLDDPGRGVTLNLKSARLCHAHERALFLRQRRGGRRCTARSLAIDDLLWDGPCCSAAKIRWTLVQSAAEYAIIHLYILE